MQYHNITKDDMLNGGGLRVVLWTAGCDHGCKGCHNQITWDPQGGLLFDQEARTEIFKELEKTYVSGLTLSGGDPLHKANLQEITALAKEVKTMYPQKNIWLYTGSTWEDIKGLDVFRYIDVVVDGEFEEDKKDVSLQWKGSANQRVIDVPKTLKSGGVILYG